MTATRRRMGWIAAGIGAALAGRVLYRRIRALELKDKAVLITEVA